MCFSSVTRDRYSGPVRHLLNSSTIPLYVCFTRKYFNGDLQIILGDIQIVDKFLFLLGTGT
jgi:hypothetical protein